MDVEHVVFLMQENRGSAGIGGSTTRPSAWMLEVANDGRRRPSRNDRPTAVDDDQAGVSRAGGRRRGVAR
jgi:hypothetical protein